MIEITKSELRTGYVARLSGVRARLAYDPWTNSEWSKVKSQGEEYWNRATTGTLTGSVGMGGLQLLLDNMNLIPFDLHRRSVWSRPEGLELIEGETIERCDSKLPGRYLIGSATCCRPKHVDALHTDGIREWGAL